MQEAFNENLLDYFPELLGLIIHTGTRNVSSLHLAEEVLSSGNGEISELGEIQYEDLLGITGIGPSKAMLIGGRLLLFLSLQ